MSGNSASPRGLFHGTVAVKSISAAEGIGEGITIEGTDESGAHVTLRYNGPALNDLKSVIKGSGGEVVVGITLNLDVHGREEGGGVIVSSTNIVDISATPSPTDLQ
jgi:hypothetical protein